MCILHFHLDLYLMRMLLKYLLTLRYSIQKCTIYLKPVYLICCKWIWGYTSFYINDQRPQYPARLHDLRLQVLASTPQSSSLKHLWSAPVSGMWQALSSRLAFGSWWIIEAGQIWSDMALLRFLCLPVYTNWIIRHPLNSYLRWYSLIMFRKYCLI